MPAAQVMQPFAPVLACDVPAAQLVHAFDPTAEYSPNAQLVHMAEFVEPNALAYRPAAHATHTVAPVLDWYVPTAQLAHTTAPAPEYMPRGQITQLEAPVLG